MRFLNSRDLMMSTLFVSLAIAGKITCAQVSGIAPPTAEEYESVRQKLKGSGNFISPDDPSLVSEVLKYRYRGFVGQTFWVSPGVATFWSTSICGPTPTEEPPPPRPKKPEPTGSPNADREAMRA